MKPPPHGCHRYGCTLRGGRDYHVGIGGFAVGSDRDDEVVHVKYLWPQTVLLLLSLGTAHADEPSVSPARARAAVAAGQIKPLAFLLTQVEARYAGQVIEAELHEANGQWSYEFELLPANGRAFVVELNAATGAVLRTQGPVQTK
jgi:hypothetical protein